MVVIEVSAVVLAVATLLLLLLVLVVSPRGTVGGRGVASPPPPGKARMEVLPLRIEEDVDTTPAADEFRG